MIIRRRFTVILLLSITTILAVSIPSNAVIRRVEGKITKVADGDTITIVIPEGTKLKVRLYSIDAPEIRHNVRPGQSYGEETKQALTALTLGRKVKVEIVDIDRYGRMVGIVYESGVNINRTDKAYMPEWQAGKTANQVQTVRPFAGVDGTVCPRVY